MTDKKTLLETIIKRRSFISHTALLAACGIIMPFYPSFAATSAKSLRLGKNGDGTRFVLDVSSEISYKMFFLSEPKRLVIDIPSLSLANIPSDVADNDCLISKIRFGEVESGVSRIVLDLADATKISRAFILPPQSGFDWRFVVDLEKTTENDFAEMINAKTVIASSGSNLTADNKNHVSNETKTSNDNAINEVSNSNKKTIILDPGHGGRDPGAIGISGVFEKEITLATGLELKKRLEKTGKYKVIMTRSKDQTLSLRKRVEIGRQARGDLFISLHADSIGKRDVKGLSIYTLSEKASDNEAAALAVRENKADIIAGIDLYNELPEVANFLIDLTRRETMNLSAEYATIMVNEMVKSFDLLRNTHRFAGFAVLKSPDVPSVLVEMGYLSNPTEEKLLRQNAYRGKIAESTVASVNKFFNSVKSASLF
ncbi:MAG: N-acetylmuramoyl-L-alanine amidase [Alphaproteobacteria bacterium]